MREGWAGVRGKEGWGVGRREGERRVKGGREVIMMVVKVNVNTVTITPSPQLP